MSLLVMNSFSFHFRKIFSQGVEFLPDTFLSFQYFNDVASSQGSICIVSKTKSVNLSLFVCMQCVFLSFFLATCNIFSFSLVLTNLFMMCLGVIFHLPYTRGSLNFLDLWIFIMFGKIYFWPSSHSFSWRTPITCILGYLKK